MQRARKVSLLILSALSTLQFSNAQAAYYYTPRATVWGLAGTQTQARGDVLLPILSNCDNILYADAQGDYARDEGNFAGIGLGARKVINNSAVVGGYLFLDRDQSKNRNFFTMLSPGIEAFFPSWDARVNGYFPVQRHSKSFLYFPSQFGNFNFISFSGHTQFEALFSLNEDAGRGGDAEIGYTFHRLHDTQLHGGVYYFNYNHHAQRILTTKNVTGFEGRLEVPVNPMWALTAMGTYDNYQHGTIVGGLRFNLGARPHCDVRYNMVEPVMRNMAGLHTGSGIPIVNTIRQVGGESSGNNPGPNPAPVPVRNNIFFFTSTGGSAFVDPITSGTIDNPLSADQFTQTVVNSIGPNAFYYFNPGSYTIGGVSTQPNTQISLLFGDSLFGRTVGWQAPATGTQRAQLLGGINLLAGSGNNTIDSVQLINNINNPTVGTTTTALTIQNVSNILVTNSVIQASSTNNTGNGSQVIAVNLLNANNVNFSSGSTITASATENGDLGVLGTPQNNFASAIYANGSTVSIANSTINATATVTGNNFGFNFATGIGGNAPANTLLKNGDKTAAPTDANFNNNTFTLTNCNINSTATVGINNIGNGNSAASIGGNAAGTSSAEFNSNNFTLTGCNLTSNAQITGTVQSGFNFASGIGGNCDGTSTNFNSNILSLNNSSINSTAQIGGDNNSDNFATGIGGNAAGGTAQFNTQTTFSLTNVAINVNATVAGNNQSGTISSALGIGGNPTATGDASFANNTIDITGGSLKVASITSGINVGINRSEGMLMDGNGNTVVINSLDFGELDGFGILAQVVGSNDGLNRATGFAAVGTSSITINDSGTALNPGNVTAEVGSGGVGMNRAFATAGSGTVTLNNTIINAQQIHHLKSNLQLSPMESAPFFLTFK